MCGSYGNLFLPCCLAHSSSPLRSITSQKSAPFQVGQKTYPAGCPLPFGCWRSLSLTSHTRWGIHNPHGLTTISGPHRAYHVPPSEDTSGLGVLSPPQAGVFAAGNLQSQFPMCLNTIASSTFRWLSLTKVLTRIHRFTVPDFPLPPRSVWIVPRLGFSPQLHTPPLPETHVRVGKRQTLTNLATKAARTSKRRLRVARRWGNRTHPTPFPGRLVSNQFPKPIRLPSVVIGLTENRTRISAMP